MAYVLLFYFLFLLEVYRLLYLGVNRDGDVTEWAYLPYTHDAKKITYSSDTMASRGGWTK